MFEISTTTARIPFGRRNGRVVSKDGTNITVGTILRTRSSVPTDFGDTRGNRDKGRGGGVQATTCGTSRRRRRRFVTRTIR